MNRTIDPRRIEAVDPAVAAILRKMQPYERIALVADAHDTARELLKAQVMRMNPGWSSEQIGREVARRLAGESDRHSAARLGRS